MGEDLFYRVSVQAMGASYDLSKDLDSFTIEQDGNLPDRAVIWASDPFKVLSHAFQEGIEVEVEIGTVKDHSLVFRGDIYRVEEEFPDGGVPQLKLTAYDKAMKMGLRKRNRQWQDMTLDQIVDSVAAAYFQQRKIELLGNPNFGGCGIRQQEETDLAFLLRLAEQSGCELYAESTDTDDIFHFVAQYKLMTTEPEFTLYHGRSGVSNQILSFEANSDVRDIQLPRVFSGIEYKTGRSLAMVTALADEVIVPEDRFKDENLVAFGKHEPTKALDMRGLAAAAPQTRKQLCDELGVAQRVITPGFVTEDQLREQGKNQFSANILGMHASGTITGNHRLRANINVEIADVGGHFSGTWHVTRVRHILGSTGYRISFECSR